MSVKHSTHPNYPNVEIPSEEVWKDVPGYEGLYQASTHGRVRSLDRVVPRGREMLTRHGCVLKFRFSKPQRRPYVDLCKNGKKQGFPLGRVILMTFVGPRPEGTECCHGDSDQYNNHLENLRWGTRAENEADKKRMGRDNAGERHGMAKLTEEQVLEIYQRTHSGEKSKYLAAEFKICVQYVNMIKRGVVWKHLKV